MSDRARVGHSLTWQDFPKRKPSFERCRGRPPGGHLARLSRERARSGAMIALGDGCFRATVVLPHHAAGCLLAYSIQLVGFIVEHLTSMCCGPQHIDVGFFVSQCLSLQRRMRPQPSRPEREQLAAPTERSGRSSNGEARGRGCHGSSASAL